jgi:hypothetical protein
LKQLAFGVSPSAFQDYFQMGKTTARDCLKKLCRAIVSSEELRSVFMRDMTRADAKRVTQVHLDEHGVDGKIGSLDCMHVGWKNCPVAWQGQFAGAKGHPTPRTTSRINRLSCSCCWARRLPAGRLERGAAAKAFCLPRH